LAIFEKFTQHNKREYGDFKGIFSNSSEIRNVISADEHRHHEIDKSNVNKYENAHTHMTLKGLLVVAMLSILNSYMS
jgi:hypothetical protein